MVSNFQNNFNSIDDKETLIYISELPGWAQDTFPKIKTLNRIQSEVFKSAFKTDENLLVCAPTGAGKTNIALLTMLQCINQFTKDGVIEKDKFKMVLSFLNRSISLP